MAARERGSVVPALHSGSSHCCHEHPWEVTSKRILDLSSREEIEQELGVGSRTKNEWEEYPEVPRSTRLGQGLLQVVNCAAG